MSKASSFCIIIKLGACCECLLLFCSCPFVAFVNRFLMNSVSSMSNRSFVYYSQSAVSFMSFPVFVASKVPLVRRWVGSFRPQGSGFVRMLSLTDSLFNSHIHPRNQPHGAGEAGKHHKCHILGAWGGQTHHWCGGGSRFQCVRHDCHGGL